MTLFTLRDKVINVQKVRRESTVVDTIIIHAMSEYCIDDRGQIIFAMDFLNDIQYGCHYFIAPDGLILNGVAPEFRTPHVGRSELQGRKWLNETSIGIEFLVPGIHLYSGFLDNLKHGDPFTGQQYQSGGELIAKLKRSFPKIDIGGGRIVGHSEVSGDDVRGEGRGKKDPGPNFDWAMLNTLIAGTEFEEESTANERLLPQ